MSVVKFKMKLIGNNLSKNCKNGFTVLVNDSLEI
jgi:hypothetical protein